MRKVLYLFMLLGLTSCSALYPSIMLKTSKNFKYTPMKDTVAVTEYKISPNDYLNFRLFSNDGLRLVDLADASDQSGSGGGANTLNYANNGVDYLVDVDGTVKLPVIGRIHLTGLTIKQATDTLEKKYATYYIKPYILLKVTNRRVVVFPGNPGTAKVIPLVNNNTTIFEAIALAGGITEDGKAKEVKLIRGSPDNPQIYLIDLSTVSGIKAGSMVLQANDIIYVTPQRRVASELLVRVTPALSLLSSILLTLALLRSYNYKF